MDAFPNSPVWLTSWRFPVQPNSPIESSFLRISWGAELYAKPPTRWLTTPHEQRPTAMAIPWNTITCLVQRIARSGSGCRVSAQQVAAPAHGISSDKRATLRLTTAGEQPALVGAGRD
jgi:hypothetical protein